MKDINASSHSHSQDDKRYLPCTNMQQADFKLNANHRQFILAQPTTNLPQISHRYVDPQRCMELSHSFSSECQQNAAQSGVPDVVSKVGSLSGGDIGQSKICVRPPLDAESGMNNSVSMKQSRNRSSPVVNHVRFLTRNTSAAVVIHANSPLTSSVLESEITRPSTSIVAMPPLTKLIKGSPDGVGLQASIAAQQSTLLRPELSGLGCASTRPNVTLVTAFTSNIVRPLPSPGNVLNLSSGNNLLEEDGRFSRYIKPTVASVMFPNVNNLFLSKPQTSQVNISPVISVTPGRAAGQQLIAQPLSIGLQAPQSLLPQRLLLGTQLQQQVQPIHIQQPLFCGQLQQQVQPVVQQQPLITPLQPQQPFLRTSLQPQQPLLGTHLQPQQPLITPLQPQQPVLVSKYLINNAVLIVPTSNPLMTTLCSGSPAVSGVMQQNAASRQQACITLSTVSSASLLKTQESLSAVRMPFSFQAGTSLVQARFGSPVGARKIIAGRKAVCAVVNVTQTSAPAGQSIVTTVTTGNHITSARALTSVFTTETSTASSTFSPTKSDTMTDIKESSSMTSLCSDDELPRRCRKMISFVPNKRRHIKANQKYHWYIPSDGVFGENVWHGGFFMAKRQRLDIDGDVGDKAICEKMDATFNSTVSDNTQKDLATGTEETGEWFCVMCKIACTGALCPQCCNFTLLSQPYKAEEVSSQMNIPSNPLINSQVGILYIIVCKQLEYLLNV